MDGGTQSRAALDEDAIKEYAEQMIQGAKFPPVVVFFDGSSHWLADGFHRCHASNQAGFLNILATVNFGTRREAVKVAIMSNHTSSVRRTNADKRHCVKLALTEYPDLSDRALADMCGVGHPFVSKVRGEQVESNSTSTPPSMECPAKDAPKEEWDKWQEQKLNINKEKKTRKGRDGKSYPSPEPRQEPEPDQGEELKPISPEEPATEETNNAPCEGMEFAEKAIRCLEKIQRNDLERKKAMRAVSQWIITHS